MEVKVLGSKEIDKERWDDLIRSSGEGNVYALSDYLDLCERDWKAVVLIEEDIYIAGIPVQYKSTFGFIHLYQDPFCPELGLFSRHKVEGETLTEMFSLVFGAYRLVSRYYFNVNNFEEVQEGEYFKNSFLNKKFTFHLTLNRPYTEIYRGYSQNRKRDIKKAYKYPQEIKLSNDVDKLIDTFKTYTAHKIGGIKEYQFMLLQNVYKTLLKKGIGEVYYVYYENKIISAAFITKFKNMVVFLFGTHTDKARELRSSTFLLDYLIKKYAGKDYIFDFEGGNDTPNLERYYASFGGEKKYFFEYKKNELPFLLKAAKNLRRVILKRMMR